MLTRPVGITRNGIVVTFFEIALCYSSRQPILHYKVDNKHGPLSLADYSVYNSRQCAHLTLYYGVPVSSTSCNLCPKSITRSNFHLSVCEQPYTPFVAVVSRAERWRRESRRARDALPLRRRKFIPIHITGET